MQVLFSNKNLNIAASICNKIHIKNWIYLDAKKIKSLANDKEEYLDLLFFEEEIAPKLFIENCLALILALKDSIDEENNGLELEYLYRFNQLFNRAILITLLDFLTRIFLS